MRRLLNIPRKQNSAAKLQALLGVPASMKLTAEEINEIVDAIDHLYNHGTGAVSHPIGTSLQFVSLRGINTTSLQETEYVAQAANRIQIVDDPNLLPLIYTLRNNIENGVINGFERNTYLLLSKSNVQAEDVVKFQSTQEPILNFGTFPGGTIQSNINNSPPLQLRENQLLQIETNNQSYYVFLGEEGLYGKGEAQVSADDFSYINNEPFQAEGPSVRIQTDRSLYFDEYTQTIRANVSPIKETFVWKGGPQEFHLAEEPEIIDAIYVGGQYLPKELDQWRIDVANKKLTILEELDYQDIISINYNYIITK